MKHDRKIKSTLAMQEEVDDREGLKSKRHMYFDQGHSKEGNAGKWRKGISARQHQTEMKCDTTRLAWHVIPYTL